MVSVAGASRYLNSATLANTQGISPIDNSGIIGRTGASLLDAGRRVNRSGIGLSSSSRQLTEQFLSRSSDVNSLFTLGAGASLSIEGLKTQIKALRSKLPASQINPDVLEAQRLQEEDDAKAYRDSIVAAALKSSRYTRGITDEEAQVFIDRALRLAGLDSKGEIIDTTA